ncbi:cytochrome c [Phaeovulum sp.]|uniref:cytochrome c n=1 Tax=Phaeovulum sp. TaxID=2934796 RepID=UPI003561465F
MKITKLATLAALALSVTFGSAHAQERKDPLLSNIEQRQAFFKLVALYYGPLNAMNKGDMPYDAAAASAAAANLALLVQLDQAALWKAGADRSFSEASTTLPKAFEDAGAIDKGLESLAAAVAALVPVAGDGLEPMKAAFAPVGGTCKDCHDAYRFKE